MRRTFFSARELTVVALVIGVAVLWGWQRTIAQEAYARGQNVVPVFEGWEPNADGSFNMVFGYFNRNWEEKVDLPIGSDNKVEPGNPDQGQPTHFYPRRNRFLFRIRVPKDFGTKELVWTLTSHGKTERTYATLKPDYYIDNIVIMNNNGAGGSGGGGFGINENKGPTLKLEGEKTRTVEVGHPVVLTSIVTDDGVPKRRVVRTQFAPLAGGPPDRPAVPRPASSAGAPPLPTLPRVGTRCCPDASSGLRHSWFVYRGAGANATFDPPQFDAWEDYRDGRNSPFSAGWAPDPVPADGKWVARVTFKEPGTYILRSQAHDGGLSATEDIIFTVK